MIMSRPLQSLHATDLLSVAELSREEIELLLSTASLLKREGHMLRGSLAGRSMVMLFEKPSLRTRMTFEIGFGKLGGQAVYADQQSCRIGERESIRDFAKNLERWTDVIVARTFSHQTIEELAEHANIPVINALSDRFHPCQALADVLTIAEHFPHRPWSDLSLAYVGDGNNVCHSLILASAILGMNVTVVTPKGYEPDGAVLTQAGNLAAASGATLALRHDLQAVADHHIVYTDTWVSMGDEQQASQRLKTFAPFQVNQQLMAAAAPDAIFMHCLPAHRDQEVATEVIDGPQSVVFDQAENRMHAQNALLVHLLASESGRNTHGMIWPDVIGAAV